MRPRSSWRSPSSRTSSCWTSELAGIDGIEVCRRIRTFSDVYVIMLTGRDAEVDRLVGLSIGAERLRDQAILSARAPWLRIQVLMRRPRSPHAEADAEPEVQSIGELSIDRGTRDVTLAGAELELTRIEYELLLALCDNPRLTLSRQQLLDRVWANHRSETITSSTCTCRTSARSSAIRRSTRDTFERSGDSASGWVTAGRSRTRRSSRRPCRMRTCVRMRDLRAYETTTYSDTEVDLFAVYCGDLGRSFLLPISDFRPIDDPVEADAAAQQPACMR